MLRLTHLNSAADARVALSGDLDVATAPQVDRALRRAQADADVVVLDLRGVCFIGAGGVELVLAADDRVREAGGHLVVVRGPDAVERLFALVDIGGRLDLVDQPPAEAAATAA